MYMFTYGASVQLVPARKFPDFLWIKKKLRRIALSPVFNFGFSKGETETKNLKLKTTGNQRRSTIYDMV